MTACDITEPVSCHTCEDSGWADIRVGDDTKALVQCPDCDGQTPAYVPGHDDRIDWLMEDR